MLESWLSGLKHLTANEEYASTVGSNPTLSASSSYLRDATFIDLETIARPKANLVFTLRGRYGLGMEHIRFILDQRYYIIETDLLKKERVVKMLEQYFPDVCIVAVDEIPKAEE